MKSRFRISRIPIWLYLHSPIKLLGKQMLIIARPLRPWLGQWAGPNVASNLGNETTSQFRL